MKAINERAYLKREAKRQAKKIEQDFKKCIEPPLIPLKNDTDFKAGDKVICVDSDGAEGDFELRQGNIYKVVKQRGNWVMVQGAVGDYFKTRFKLMKELNVHNVTEPE